MQGSAWTAGELRFIFNVVQPTGAGTEATCDKKLFTVIFKVKGSIDDTGDAVRAVQALSH